MIKRSLGAIAGLFALLVAIVLFRTFTYGAEGAELEQVELPATPQIALADAAQHLSTAIRFETVTYQGGDPAPEAAQPWLDLHNWLATTYPRVHAEMQLETLADYSLLYKWRGRDDTLDPIILMAHQDVVPVNDGTLEDWAEPPFSGKITDGYIYGRGALDDKGSLIAIMEAGEALIGAGFQPSRTVYFMFGHDEEVAGRGAQTMVDALYERGVRAELVLDEGFFVIEDNPITGKPFGFIGVSEKGYATLRIIARGQGGHSSQPPRDSANVRLARAILALEGQQMEADFSKPPVSELFAASAKDMGFFRRMAFANLWLFQGLIEGQMREGPANAMIRTTTAPTMLEGSIKENVLPQRSSAIINFRLHPNDTLEGLIAHVEAALADIEGLEIEIVGGGIASEASPVSPSDTHAFAVLSAVAAEVGASAAGEAVSTGPGLVIGGTDARFAYKISDNVYRFYPGSMSLSEVAGFHGTNERLSVDNLERMVRGYMQLILAMDAG